MMKDFDLICVGLANISLSIRPVSPAIFQNDVTLVDPIAARLGGDALNESLTAARLGNRVGLVSKVGNDLFGRMLIDSVRADGVNADWIRVCDTDTTAVAALLIDAGGDRNICAHRGAISSFNLDDIDLAVFDRTRTVCIGSMFILKSLDGTGVTTILRRARQAGALTCADMKADTYHLGFDGISQVFPWLDYFLPSFDEALYLTGERDPDRQCDILIAAGCRNVVVKLGGEGCYLATADSRILIPPCPANRVDTTGAGDHFVAGFITGINRCWPPEQAARFANATAAICIQQIGSNGAVRSFDQVIAYMKQVNY